MSANRLTMPMSTTKTTAGDAFRKRDNMSVPPFVQ